MRECRLSSFGLLLTIHYHTIKGTCYHLVIISSSSWYDFVRLFFAISTQVKVEISEILFLEKSLNFVEIIHFDSVESSFRMFRKCFLLCLLPKMRTEYSHAFWIQSNWIGLCSVDFHWPDNSYVCLPFCLNRSELEKALLTNLRSF